MTDKYQGLERREGDHWHLRKEINVGHIISTLLLAVAVFTWSTNIDKRITILETKQQQQDKSSQEMSERMQRQMQEISAKLDKLIDRELNKGTK